MRVIGFGLVFEVRYFANPRYNLCKLPEDFWAHLLRLWTYQQCAPSLTERCGSGEMGLYRQQPARTFGKCSHSVLERMPESLLKCYDEMLADVLKFQSGIGRVSNPRGLCGKEFGSLLRREARAHAAPIRLSIQKLLEAPCFQGRARCLL